MRRCGPPTSTPAWWDRPLPTRRGCIFHQPRLIPAVLLSRLTYGLSTTLAMTPVGGPLGPTPGWIGPVVTAFRPGLTIERCFALETTGGASLPAVLQPCGSLAGLGASAEAACFSGGLHQLPQLAVLYAALDPGGPFETQTRSALGAGGWGPLSRRRSRCWIRSLFALGAGDQPAATPPQASWAFQAGDFWCLKEDVAADLFWSLPAPGVRRGGGPIVLWLADQRSTGAPPSGAAVWRLWIAWRQGASGR